MRTLACLAVFAAALGPPTSVASGATEQRIERIQSGILPAVLVKGEPTSVTSLAARMKALHVPGVSIAVIHEGKLEWKRGFGVARPGGPAVTPETLFQAASISKPVAAMLVMRLVQEGRLDLDADVNRYLKTWKVPSNEFTKEAKVTLRGLLTHSAGVTVHGFAGYEAGVPVPGIAQILDGSAPANNDPIRVDQIPGKSWRYSGGGYVIAQLVVEDVMGAGFVKLVRDRVLQPLGMTLSTYEQPLPEGQSAHAASPYESDGTTVVKGGPHVYPESAAASLWTTPSDLARYAIGVQKALAGQAAPVISQATARSMLRPVIGEQALGPAVGGAVGHRYFQHGGTNEGYQCFFVAYESGDGAVIMTNSDNGHRLIAELLRTIAQEYGWPDYRPVERTLARIAPEAFDRHSGAFEWESGEIVTFWRERNHFVARIWGQPIVELFPSSEHEFFTRIVDARYEFASSASGADTVTLYQDGQTWPAKRLDGAKGRAALEISIATEERYKDQVAAPGSEAALRRLIAGIASGKPGYDEINPELAEVLRRRLPYFQEVFTKAGALRSVTFKRVEPDGMDVYEVRFDRDWREAQILLDSDGHIDTAAFHQGLQRADRSRT